jgi:hypothetical protein
MPCASVWECRPGTRHHGFREPTQLAKKEQRCHSPASSSSPSRSTASPPAKSDARRTVRPRRRTAAPMDVRHAVVARDGRQAGRQRRHRRRLLAAVRSRDRRRDHGCANKFGHPGWHEDPEWKGAWGPNPPFHTPTFILTHHPRLSIEMEGMHIVVVRSCSAEAYASGTDWRASRRTTRSRPPPRPAKSRIGHSSVRVAAREPDHDRARRPGHPLGLRGVHGIAQMRDTHTGDDCRIPEDGRCVREVVEQPHSCA